MKEKKTITIANLMKKVVFLFLFLLGTTVGFAQGKKPVLEFVLQLRVKIGAFDRVGETAHGVRQSIAITGGTFHGPSIKGDVLPGGADYQLTDPKTGRTELEAIYNIRTDDGVTIHVRNRGIISQDNGKTYFFTSPQFEAPSDSKYAWLSNSIFVCRISDEDTMKDGVVLNVWRVRDEK